MKPIAHSTLTLIALLIGGFGATVSLADTLAGQVETMRDYDLSEVDGTSPPRPLRFYIGENSRFAACGECLCVTGIMTGRYPRLGIRPTSASPTFACEQDSAAFRTDSDLLGRFFDMKRARVEGDTMLLEDDEGQTMTFRLGGAELSPP